MQRLTSRLDPRLWNRAAASMPRTQLPLTRTFTSQLKLEEHRTMMGGRQTGSSDFTASDRKILQDISRMTMRQESRRQESSGSHWCVDKHSHHYSSFLTEQIRPEGAGVVLGFLLGATATCAALLEHTFPSIGRRDDKAAAGTTAGGKMGEVTSEVSSGGEMGEWTSA